MERTKLINTMKIIMNYCEGIKECIDCEIRNECEDNFIYDPYVWDLDGEDE